MNLIANTGIQFFTVPFEVDLNNNYKMYFHEWFDMEDEQLKLEIAHFFSEDEIWVRKRDVFNLLGLGLTGGEVGRIEDGKFKKYLWEEVKNDFFEEGYAILVPNETEDGGTDCFSINPSRCRWEKFENRWLPCPFFALDNNGKSEFAPTNWCRCKLIPDTGNTAHAKGNVKNYNLLFVFDTRTKYEDENFEEEDLMETPVFANNFDHSKDFALCNNEFSLVDFCSKSRNCEWVDEYLLNIYHSTENGRVRNIDDVKCKKPKMKYLAEYIYIMKYMQKFGNLPVIPLFSDKNIAFGNVDLVVDIGNSRTCAVLFDNSDFTKVETLKLQNLSNPFIDGKLNCCGDTFDMRLAFHKVEFGVDTLRDSMQFSFPSLVRMGTEANELIHKAVNCHTGLETITTFSSPKRYLWDEKPRPKEKEWAFLTWDENPTPGDKRNRMTYFYLKGISEQLNFDGSLNATGGGGVDKRYSRKALMTFGMLEILAQAKMQINSYEFRHKWGEENKPRTVGRIIVTCPAAMSMVEQTALRKCAEDASVILNRFYNWTPYDEMNEKETGKNVCVIPSVKSLKKKEERKEWIYDEATCSQFVYLYAELTKRYRVDKSPKNCRDYFNLYGKVRKDLEGYEKKSLTIGSVDIGAGTTDVMIAAYKYDDAGQCTLTPVPLFWESFYMAGDDLLKNLIRKLVIEGHYAAIHQKLQDMGRGDMAKRILDFFAEDNARQDVECRQMRSEFNLQVSVPVVSRFLELMNEDSKNVTLSYDEVFLHNPPSGRVLDYFEKHFGFSAKDLQWNYDREVVTKIIESTFDGLIGKISTVLSYYGCNIVLLAGRPTSLKPLSDLFLKYYAVSPNRLITLNDYRIGTWYPFQDGKGYFRDAKSIVAVGAMIGNYAATRGSLDGFSLDLSELIDKMLPTTEYFAKAEDEEPFITPFINNAGIEVSQLPLRIWTRQLNTSSYPTRPFYMLDFDRDRIEKRIREKFALDESDPNGIDNAVENEIIRIRRLIPFKFNLVRESYREDRESLKIDSITDRNGDDLPTACFSLQIQSMNESEDYWLDSGIFTNLSIN